MNLNRSAVALVPRTTSNCLDLAAIVVRRHFRAVAGITLLIAAPAVVVVWMLCTFFEFDMRLAIVVWYFATAPLGVLLASGVVPATFGESFTRPSPQRDQSAKVRRELLCNVLMLACAACVIIGFAFRDRFEASNSVLPQLSLTAVFGLSLTLLVAIGLFPAGGPRWSKPASGALSYTIIIRALLGLVPAMCLFESTWRIGLGISAVWLLPASFAAVRNGFVAERVAMQNLDKRLHDRRTDGLLKTESGDLFVRGGWVVCFCGMLAVVLASTLIFAMSVLFGMNLFEEFLQAAQGFEPDDVVANGAVFLWTDPRVVAVTTFVLFLVYPLGRLAWYLCYLDVRIRRDCWDMELEMTQEAERLREQIPGTR